MAHVRQQIRDAVVAELTGIPGVQSIHSGRSFALNEDLLPSVNVMVSGESIQFSDTSDDLDREMEFEVQIATLGSDNSDDLLDDISIHVENRLASAGGAPWEDILIFHLSRVDFSIGEPAEKTPYALRMRYRARLISSGPESIGC